MIRPTKRIMSGIAGALVLLVLVGGVAAVEGAAPGYMADLARWRAADGAFDDWARQGVKLGEDGSLVLDAERAQPGRDPFVPGTYHGGRFYNGSTYLVGEASSPVVEGSFPFSQVIPSWNADTPAGTWIAVQMRARLGSRWTRWYNLGIWASGKESVQRHSVRGQKDADGSVDTDTLVLGTASKPASAGALQMKVRLFSANPSASPRLRAASAAYSTRPVRPTALEPGSKERWGKVLPVPECSQMVYPDGGEVWCSPTTLSMALAYWEAKEGECEPRVRASVAGVYDWVYRGHGNWPFNTAYAATLGLEGYVTRFTSLAQAERWTNAGVPVVVSFSWGRGQLTGAPIAASNGHIALLVGFDAAGNPVVNDPAARTNGAVQRTYPRAQFERLWLERTGGTVYLMYPPGWPIPR